MQAKPRGDRCPSCDRFIGPADRCPYCGEASAKSPFIRHLRVAAFLLAFVGLVCLYQAIRHRELPVVAVRAITPLMNFATVRVVGTVRGEVRVMHEHGEVDYLSFLLDDGSGRIRVQAYAEGARQLVASGRVPGRGALVDVAGSLNVAAEGLPKLRLQAPDQLHILTDRPPAAEGE